MVRKKKQLDIEKAYAKRQFVQKLRRFAVTLEQDKKFHIRVTGERVYVPSLVAINIEHERDGAN